MGGLIRWRPTSPLVGASEPHRHSTEGTPLLVAPSGQGPLVVEIAGRIDRADIPVLCRRVRVALEASPTDLVVCDVGALAEPDCVAIDALARMALTAKRLGRCLQLREVSRELRALLCFVGLDELLAREAMSGVEPRRQAE